MSQILIFYKDPDKREYLMIPVIFLISHQDGSDEGSQHMFLCRINKNYLLLSPNTPTNLELCNIVSSYIKEYSLDRFPIVID